MKTVISMSDVHREQDPSRWASDYAMSGADQALARHPEIVAFLGKAYAEDVNDRRDWPMFDTQRLGKFLSAAGVDLDATIKADLDAMEIPEDLTEMAICMEKMNGASFLTRPAGQTCMALRTRQKSSNSRRGSPGGENQGGK